MKPAEAIVYDMIVQAAEAGAVCPTNAEICAACGFASFGSSARAVQNLEAEGLITVERGSRSRVATVLASGKRTALPPQGAPPGQQRRTMAQADQFAELVAEGATIAAAAKALRVSEARGYQIWGAIKAGPGAQAV